MPIEDYDRLPVKEILPRLTTLTASELKAVTAYERAGKNRVTLLKAVRKVELLREANAPSTVPAQAKTVAKAPAQAKAPAKTRGQAPAKASTPPPPPAPVAPPARLSVVADDADDLEEEFADDFRADEYRADEFMADDFRSDDFTDDVTSADVRADDIRADEGRSDDIRADDLIADDFLADAPVREPVRAHVAVAKKSRRKPAVKAPTWEEEVRPQLPKRMTSSTYDFDFEPPVVGLPPAEHDASLIPLPEATPIPAAGDKVKKLKASRPAQVARKFEHVALVMAAILAVLLGLAIGTVLARTGGNDAATPATVTQSAAATQPAG